MERDIFGKGCGLVRQKGRCQFIELFELVMANQADFPVRPQSHVLKVSASDFYAWRQPSPQAIGNAILVERICTIHAESDGTYGRARVRAELIDQRVKVSSKRAARLMLLAGLRGVSRRRKSR